MELKKWTNIDLSDVKGILLDLDDTLYHYNESHEIAYQKSKSVAAIKYNINQDDFDTNWVKARQTVHDTLHGQAASHSRLLYFQNLFEQVFGYTNAEFTLEMEEIYWHTFLESMQWKKGAEQFLKEANKRLISICLITDLTAQIQFQKWEKLGLQNYVKFMVSSEEAGIEKPNKKIFELCLKKLNMQTSEVIMLGDSLSKDIEGAKTMGIRSYRILKNTE